MQATFCILIAAVCVTLTSSQYLMGGHVNNSNTPKPFLEKVELPVDLARSAQLDDPDLDLNAEESTVMPLSHEAGGRYRLPYSFAFNGGRPFSLEKDPITGKIDFEKAPPVRALNFTNRYPVDPEDVEEVVDKNISSKQVVSYRLQQKTENKDEEDISPNEINPDSPQFHDFLNLPVHYSSEKYEKDKYPLISSSYANTKVQSGLNSYNTYNHKPYHGETVLHYPTRRPHVPKTITTTTASTTAKSRPTYVPTTVFTTTSIMATSAQPTMPTITVSTSSSTTSSSTKAPAVTTWKPATSTMRYVELMDNDEDVLPIEKLQASIYIGGQQGSNNIFHIQDPQTKIPIKDDEYESYDDYEIYESDDKDYLSLKESVTESAVKNAYRNNTISMISTSTMSDKISDSTKAITTAPPTPGVTAMATSTSNVTATTAPKMTPTTTAVPSWPSISVSVSEENIVSNSPSEFQVVSHRPVTSMPLGGDRREPSMFDNTVDNRRPVLNNPLMNQGYRQKQITNQKLGTAASVLVESTSNIVIPPDQDTVSFVLGNKQNVQNGFYSLGSAIGENPYSGATDLSSRPIYGTSSGAADKGNYDSQVDRRGTIALHSGAAVVDSGPDFAPQTWRPPAAITAAKKLVNDIDSSRIQSSLIKGSVLPEQPVAKKDEKDINYVVFPQDEESKHPIEEHIVVINEADGTIREITQSTTTVKTKQEVAVPNSEGLPELSEKLTPPAQHPKPVPPFYQQYQNGATMQPDHPRPLRLPLPQRGKQPTSPIHLLAAEPNGIRRRPYKPDSNLPNILPQFRPNAKTSHGHRGSEAIGTITAGQYYSTRVRQTLPSHLPGRKPLSPPPSYLQRLNPPPPPIHALRLAGAASSKTEIVHSVREPELPVKRFRVPSVAPVSSARADEEKKQMGRVTGQKMRLEKDEMPDRFSEEPLQLPPRPPLFPKRKNAADIPHIATLQMIQQHGEFIENSEQPPSIVTSLSTRVTNESDAIVTGQDIKRRKSDNHEQSVAETPVYVVYPVNTAVNIHPDDSREKDESVIIGTHGPHRPLPPETLLQGTEANGSNGEDSSNFFSNLPVPSGFPYPYERLDSSILTGIKETPLLVPSDQRDKQVTSQSPGDKHQEKEEKDTSLNIIPYLQDFVPFPAKKSDSAISATLHRLSSTPSSTPIAYVYTPTAQVSHRLDTEMTDEDISKIDRIDQKPILLPSQQPSSSSSSAPSPQNFMAPFVASLSAEAPIKNGWSVVMVDPLINKKSDESTVGDTSDNEDVEITKEEFDVENFKPQLFGGFKPIYEFSIEGVDGTEHSDNTDINLEIPVRAEESETPIA